MNLFEHVDQKEQKKISGRIKSVTIEKFDGSLYDVVMFVNREYTRNEKRQLKTKTDMICTKKFSEQTTSNLFGCQKILGKVKTKKK